MTNGFLKSVLESLGHPFYVVDASTHRILMANSASGDISSAETLTCHSLTHGRPTPCNDPDHPCPVAEVKRSKRPSIVEHLHFDKHGRVRHVEVRAYPIFDDDREVIQVILYALDTTDRRLAEQALRQAHHQLEIRVAQRTSQLEEMNDSLLAEIAERTRVEGALRESEERFRTIFESAQDYIFIKDRSLKYSHVNPAIVKLFGVPASQIVGCAYEDFFDDEGAAYIREVDFRVLAGQTIEHEYTRRFKGTTMTFHEVRVPLRDSSGNIIGLCGISRDVTHRRRSDSSCPVTLRHYPSDAMGRTLDEARHAAAGGGVVLLAGESGAGKDYLARWIHDRSARCNGPFFAINCAAISKELAESELFGHEAGAFTGARGVKRGLLELAEGGTLLLNEIGELSTELQSKLLTFLDTKSFMRVGGQKAVQVNARIIAATNRNLEAETSEGRFLPALFYRLNVLTIRIPPLRERIEDIPLLLEELMAGLAAELQLTQIPVINPADVIGLVRYHWPGNVRELRNVLERALMLWDGDNFHIGLPRTSREADEQERSVRGLVPKGRTLHEVTAEVTQFLCSDALRRCEGNKSATARLLGISRDTLYRYLKQYGIHEDLV
ncbi:MAG: sigma 54-interacting transcriptional regulator [Thermodesulfobacteriota bacterium]